MTVVGIHHVQIACPPGAEDALRGFYVGVLGLVEKPKTPVMAARGGAWFVAGAQELHVGAEEPFVPARKAHPCLLVDDVGAVAAAVEAGGAPVRWNEEMAGVRRFHTDDPVGNRVEIQQA